ncbi:hypothetical protein FHG68_19375 [Leptospira weilii]|nr:hypothetical protein FHG67_19330 [Leptospira weilii]QDK28838.1 hypothetical protein FHG68_19375 [Leptospira weilii]
MFDGFFIGIDFILTLFTVIFTLLIKSLLTEGEIKKILISYFYNSEVLLILILIPLSLYVLLTIHHFEQDLRLSWLLVTGPVLGFILSLLHILYIELTQRLKKVRLLYFFVIACVCAILIGFSSLILPR